MTVTDLLKATIAVALFVFLVLIGVSLITLRWRRHRGKSWEERGPVLFRYLGLRIAISIGIGACFLVVLAAALTLNTHRPPADNNPVIRLAGTRGPVNVQLSTDQCGEAVTGLIETRPVRGKPLHASIYSDQDNLQKIRLSPQGRGRFLLTGPTTKRGLLSCYLELPVVDGNHGPSVISVRLGTDQQVDSPTSIPEPDGYRRGAWQWRCQAGEQCPSLVAFGSAIEPGTEQVIVLVLASVFGAIIAVFVAEMLLEPMRRKLDSRGKD